MKETEDTIKTHIYRLNFNSRLPVYIESTHDYFSFLVQLDVAPFFLKLEKKTKLEGHDGRKAIVKSDLSSVENWNLPKISDKEARQQDSLYNLVP